MAVAKIMSGATLTPTKLELLQAWLPQQDWYPGGDVAVLGTYRFVDPAGEVGIESFLLDCGGTTVHLPLTYRAAPLDGATLIGTMEHSELGTRYTYDGRSDPVYVTELLRTVAEADTEAELSNGKEPTAHCEGSGADYGTVSAVAAAEQPQAHAQCGTLVADVPVLAGTVDTDAALGTLTARWDGGEAVVAAVRHA